MSTTFEMSLSQQDIDQFFAAVGWSLDARPENPPTIATMFRNGEFQILQEQGVPLQNVLHGEQKYRFLNPLRAGQKYRGEASLASNVEKGKMRFFIFQTKLVEATTDTVCIESFTTIIARGVAK